MVLGAGTLGSTEILLARAPRAWPCRTAGPRFLRQRRHHRLRLQRRARGRRHRRGHPPACRASTWAPTSPAESSTWTSRTRRAASPSRRACCPSALAPLLPVLFIAQRSAARRPAEPRQRGLPTGPFANLQRLGVSTTAPRRATCWRIPASLSPGPASGERRLSVPRRRPRRSGEGVTAATSDPLARTMMGRQPATAPPWEATASTTTATRAS